VFQTPSTKLRGHQAWPKTSPNGLFNLGHGRQRNSLAGKQGHRPLRSRTRVDCRCTAQAWAKKATLAGDVMMLELSCYCTRFEPTATSKPGHMPQLFFSSNASRSRNSDRGGHHDLEVLWLGRMSVRVMDRG